MECIKCHAIIADDSMFCNYCGKQQSPPPHAPKRRGNGQGTIYRAPSGTWTAEVTLGYYTDTDGKLKRRKRKKYGFRTKKEAAAYIETLRTERTRPRTVTVQQLWEQFQGTLEELSKSKRTAYRIAWGKLGDDIRFRAIDDLTVPELQAAVDEGGSSFYTKRDIKSLLSHLFKLALQDDYTDKNRAQFIRLPSLEAAEREIFTDAEIGTLWEHWQLHRDAVAAHMLVMLYTGIRPGELLGIRTENVYLDEHYMTGGIKTTKGKRRKIIIPTKLEPVIRDLLDHAQRGKLAWYNKSEDFYNAWKQLRTELSLREELTPYCCRHTYITRLTALKVSPAMLQELAGHEDYETTLDYTHLSVDDRLEEVDRLL